MSLKKFTKDTIVAEYDREVQACVNPQPNAPEVLPQWIQQSLGHATVALAAGEVIEGLPDETKTRLDFFGQWVQTERYVTGEHIKEARDILVLPCVMDFVFAMMKKNADSGVYTEKTYFDTEIP